MINCLSVTVLKPIIHVKNVMESGNVARVIHEMIYRIYFGLDVYEELRYSARYYYDWTKYFVKIYSNFTKRRQIKDDILSGITAKFCWLKTTY